MNKLKKLIALFAAVTTASFSVIFCACESRDYIDISAFSSYVHAEVYGGKLSEQCKIELKTLFSDLDSDFSIKNETSFTARINGLSAEKTITPTEREAEVYRLAEACYELTEGLFDPTILPFVKLWKFYPDFPDVNFAPPSDSDITEIIKAGKVNFLNINELNGTLSVSCGAEIDFGGILKGYAADKAAEILIQHGFTRGYVNVGGSSLKLLKTDALGINHPRKSGKIIEVNTKNFSNVSISTSGDYERCYSFGGENYCHIINPKSGKTADNGIASATIIAKNGALADGVTTALLLCSFDKEHPEESELAKMLKKIETDENFNGFSYYIIYERDKLVITNKTENSDFTLSDKEYDVVNI